jgi:outer membrane protein TolC
MQPRLPSVEAEVADAYERMEEARRLINTQQLSRAESREAFELARTQLQAGEGTQIDVLSSQLALTQARLTELQAMFNYHIAAADLDRAIGSSKSYQLFFDDPLLREDHIRQRASSGK